MPTILAVPWQEAPTDGCRIGNTTHGRVQGVSKDRGKPRGDLERVRHARLGWQTKLAIPLP